MQHNLRHSSKMSSEGCKQMAIVVTAGVTSYSMLFAGAKVTYSRVQS